MMRRAAVRQTEMAVRKILPLVVLLYAAPAAAQALHPGLWEIKLHFTRVFMGKDMTAIVNQRTAGNPTHRECMQPEEAYLTKMLEAMGSLCTFDNKELSANTVHLRAICHSAMVPGSAQPPSSATVSLDGPYTPDSLTLTGSYVGTMRGKPVDMQGMIEAHRLSPCPIPRPGDHDVVLKPSGK